jgi:hypothetical protein
METMTHVDDWIDDVYGCSDAERYAKFCLMLARMPASMQHAFKEFTAQFTLYCTHNGMRYKVTGASRMGDVWLDSNLQRESGYELRVHVDACEAWSPYP